MPDVIIRNDTPYTINVGLWLAGALVYHRNVLPPGETCRPHLASLFHTFEFRKDEGSNRFSPADTGETFGKIASAWGAGASSVLMGAAWGLGMLGVGGMGGRSVSVATTKQAFTAVSATMETAGRRALPFFHAARGTYLNHLYIVGAEYYGESQGSLLTVKGVVIPLWETRQYIVQRVDCKVRMWDVDSKCVRGERQDEVNRLEASFLCLFHRLTGCAIPQ
ncbi:hypothetical protein OF83DRAFT_1130627 [Amylostereum chailletii]|nr:hypothetical protein OF83DRAFT_1130627 [Amylostereum chailletii]